MSAARPITLAINELKRCAEEMRVSHTINGVWPPEETIARLEYTRLLCTIKNAEAEWARVRQETLRLNQIESTQDNAA